MSIDTVYIEAAIETLDLINQLTSFLASKEQTGEMTKYLSEILQKADARISSSLGKALGINIPVDQEGKSTKYWEGVRDTAKLSTQKWTALGEINTFSSFLSATKSNLAARLGIKETEVNPLEEFVTETPVAEPNPLEDILSSAPAEPEPQPTPIPIIPTTPPIKPEPIPEPEPEVTIPTPTPITPTPTPTPIATPTPDPVVTPEPSDKLAALGEALETSGIETPEVPQPSPSLSDMLLSKEESGDKPEEEDDMLSLSLREALKILRDEDED